MLWKQKKFDQARQTEAHIASIADPSKYPETTMTRMLMRALIEITDHKLNDAARAPPGNCHCTEMALRSAQVFDPAECLACH